MANHRIVGRLMAFLGLAAAALVVGPARAAAPEKAAPSLAQVPADAAFYSASLRLGAQWDKFRKSNAFARLEALPALQFALQQAQAEAQKPGNPAGPFLTLLNDPANRQLLALLGEMMSEECYVYGAADWTNFSELLMQVAGAARYGPAMMRLNGGVGGDSYALQARMILSVLNENANRLRFPDTVLGFRLKNRDAALTQLGRLEKLLKRQLEQTPLKGRLKRTKVASGDFLVLELDGLLVPWDQMPWDKLASKDGEFSNLRKRLKALKLTIALGVRDNYLLLSFGPGTDGIAKLGHGPSLAGRTELKPLAKYADRPITGVSYTSARLLSAFGTRPSEIDGMLEMANAALQKAPLSDEQRTKLLKDLNGLAKDWKESLSKAAPSMSFSFLSDRGQESFGYSFAEGAQAPSQQLTILDHLGGSPLLALAGRTGDATPGYLKLVKWLKVFYGDFEEIVLPQVPEGQREQFEAVKKIVLPLLERFDEITGKQFLPSLADGQAALVLDAKWTSGHWFPNQPAVKKPLPMLELGLIHSVSDAELLTKALQGYRRLINDVLDTARQMGAHIPNEASLPKPQSKKVTGGTLYWWPLPAVGLDPQLRPNFAIGPHVLVVTLSEGHSERLLKSMPLKVDGGPLAQHRPLVGAVVFDFAGLVKAARPWVEEVMLAEALKQAPDNLPPGLSKKDIAEQVRTVLDVLQCLRGVTSATYVENGAVVTHTETVFHDLPGK